MIRVMVADDHNLVRQGIRALLEKMDNIQVVGEASDGLEAVDMALQLIPDVIIMDLMMPHMNGVQAIRQIHNLLPKIHIIVLSMHCDDPLIQQVLRAGARGYLLKRSIVEELVFALHSASQGEVYLSSAVSSILVNRAIRTPRSSEENCLLDRLTPREQQVLQLLAEGKTNALIAQALSISEKTVEKHRASLMKKLDIHDLTGLVRIAIKYHLINVED